MQVHLLSVHGSVGKLSDNDSGPEMFAAKNMSAAQQAANGEQAAHGQQQQSESSPTLPEAQANGALSSHLAGEPAAGTRREAY